MQSAVPVPQGVSWAHHHKEAPVHLTMTVIDTRHAGTAPRQVVIEAASGTRFGDVRSLLSNCVGVPA
jgi:hypothetical protein